jgi:predicted DNA binding protein
MTRTTIRVTFPDVDPVDVVAACERYGIKDYTITTSPNQTELEAAVPTAAAEEVLTALNWGCGRFNLDEKRPSGAPTDIVPVDRSPLSPRQRDTLAAAVELGYYEWPRDTDSAGVADELGVAQPTVSKHRRRGHQKLLTQLFPDDA